MNAGGHEWVAGGTAHFDDDVGMAQQSRRTAHPWPRVLWFLLGWCSTSTAMLRRVNSRSGMIAPRTLGGIVFAAQEMGEGIDDQQVDAVFVAQFQKSARLALAIPRGRGWHGRAAGRSKKQTWLPNP